MTHTVIITAQSLSSGQLYSFSACTYTCIQNQEWTEQQKKTIDVISLISVARLWSTEIISNKYVVDVHFTIQVMHKRSNKLCLLVLSVIRDVGTTNLSEMCLKLQSMQYGCFKIVDFLYYMYAYEHKFCCTFILSICISNSKLSVQQGKHTVSTLYITVESPKQEFTHLSLMERFSSLSRLASHTQCSRRNLVFGTLPMY